MWTLGMLIDSVWISLAVLAWLRSEHIKARRIDRMTSDRAAGNGQVTGMTRQRRATVAPDRPHAHRRRGGDPPLPGRRLVRAHPGARRQHTRAGPTSWNGR